MSPNSISEIIKIANSSVPLKWSLAIFAATFIILFILKVIKRLNPIAKNSKLVWFIRLGALPAIIITSEQIINFTLQTAGTDISLYTKKLSYIFLWIAGGRLVTDAINIFIWNVIVRKKPEEPIPKILTNFVSGIVYLFVIYFIITIVFNIHITGLLVSSGIIAGILGLSMQNILSDFIAGIAIAINKPYKIGDWIEFTDGTIGEVIDINWRSTKLQSWKRSIYIVPNSKSMESTLHNFNLPNKKYSSIFYVTISPDVPPETARRILLKSALSCDVIIKNPPPVVFLADIEKRPYRYMVSATYTDYPSHFSGRDQLMMNIWSNFNKVGIKSSCDTNEVQFSRKDLQPISDPGITELIKEIPIFKTLSASEIERLSSDAKLHLFRASEYIVREGESGTSLLLITAGVVSVSHRPIKGNQIELKRCGLGEALGEASLLTGEPSNSDIIAITDCQIVEVSKESMEEIIRERPELLDELAEIMAKRRIERDSMLHKPHKKSPSELLSTYAIEILNSMKDFFRI